MRLLKQVRNDVLPILANVGFRLDALCSDNRRVVVLFRVSELACVYLRVRYRVHLDADVWIAPIEFPDDRIVDLPSYQIKVLLPPVDLASKELFPSIARRVLAIHDAFPSLARAVEAQIESPIFEADRAARFREVRAAYETMRSAIDRPDDPVPNRIDELAARTAAGKLSGDSELLVECTTVAKRIIREGMPAAFETPTFEGQARNVGMEVCSQFYMEALLPDY